MENVKLVFCGTSESKTNDVTLELFATNDNDLMIIIESNGVEIINLSKQTAIRLSKELKKQIALLD